MRLSLPSCVCLALLTGCSVDRYTLRGRVVMTDTSAGAGSLRPAQAEALPNRPLEGALVSLVVDADDSLHRRELGTFECDAHGAFQVPDINAVGAEVIPYRLRISAYAKDCTPLHCDTTLPGPGRILVLRMTPADPNAPGGQARPPAPTRGGPPTGDDYLRNTLRESEPYLTGKK